MQRTTDQALPNTVCPLCGRPNQCAPARSGNLHASCWCASAKFPLGLLARVPAEVRGKACICRDCLEKYLTEG
jgi:hypothetical protein